MNLIQELNKETLQNEVTRVQIGDTVRVHVKVKEGSRERIQVFEGTVIAKKVFPVPSPSIDTIEVVRSGDVRRAKLYYLRGRVGKGAKVKEKL